MLLTLFYCIVTIIARPLVASIWTVVDTAVQRFLTNPLAQEFFTTFYPPIFFATRTIKCDGPCAWSTWSGMTEVHTFMGTVDTTPQCPSTHFTTTVRYQPFIAVPFRIL